MVSGPVTSVARVEDVQIFLKNPVYMILFIGNYCQGLTATQFRDFIISNIECMGNFKFCTKAHGIN